ncbi:isochorismatase [Pseudovibrio japonicus]|uniref:Isochorismatase n=1 Tax=Pseudovibrio japonicus TaxID=366534 RepID=A0ABQ3ENC6_9HYPH|nr:isochorismatase family cysteine hydrolase [Pseudovibrio japonicus]GHB48231.1 isochorismatase [Pseudovibrio japonicus]
MGSWNLIGFVVLVLVIGVGYTAFQIMRKQRARRGEMIDRSKQDQIALVVVDVQEDFTKDTKARKWPSSYVEERIARINVLAAEAQARGQPVIAVRHIFDGTVTNFLIGLFGEGLGTKGSDGLALDARLRFQPSVDVVKHVGDAFTSNELEAFLKAHKIGRLRIVGLDGCYCVKSTALGALSRGYDVELVEDAVLSIKQKAWEGCRTELAKRGVRFAKSAQLAEAQ